MTDQRDEAGLTLVEMMLALALIAVALSLTVNTFANWAGREDMRSGAYTIQIFLRLAQTEAAARGHACRFLLDTTTRQLSVVDLNDPAVATDDVVLSSTTLSGRVLFANPAGDPPVTLELLTGGVYGTTFVSDGGVSAGAGQISIQGSSVFCRITVLGAGGTRVDRWEGTAWTRGS
jgi:prepilin-type N-terminal cleavage/methylation domain-containing protein